MTSHDTALEAARTAIRKAAFRDPMADISSLAEVVLSAYISTLSPDVSGLVERLKDPIGPGSKLWPDGNKPDPLCVEAADALTALSLQLAAVEKERDSYAQHSVENSMRAFNWMAAHDALKAGVPYEYPTPEDVPNIVARAETAEASLTLAQEENERLRAAVKVGSNYIERYHFAAESRNATALVARMRATLSTPSKEDKP